MARNTITLLGGGLLLAAAALLAGCASSTGATTATSPAAGSPAAEQSELAAGWLDDGRLIGLVTYGSSGCVPVADPATLEGDTLTVELSLPDPAAACTADYAPRVTLVAAPEGIDPATDLTVRVTGGIADGSTVLPGAAGLSGSGATEYLPTAGWTAQDGMFVYVTWGSSSCVPVVQDVAATGPAQVTLSFVDPPADQMCTMDMAPRGGVATVVGLEQGSDVELVLTGDAFDGVTTTIYGQN